MLKIIGLLLLGYFIGSIPFGFIFGKLKGIDIRKVGSGNIGATNIYRNLGGTLAVIVLVLDLLKGTLAVYLSSILIGQPAINVAAGLAAVIGHMYPVYLGFKGGKGSATGLGVLLGIAPDLFGITLIYVIAAIAVTRYVSLTSITGVLLLAVLMIAFQKPVEYSIVTVIVAILIIIRHIPNIKRLLAGKEPKIWGNSPLTPLHFMERGMNSPKAKKGVRK